MSIGEALLIPPAFVHESRVALGSDLRQRHYSGSISGSCESAKVVT